MGEPSSSGGGSQCSSKRKVEDSVEGVFKERRNSEFVRTKSTPESEKLNIARSTGVQFVKIVITGENRKISTTNPKQLKTQLDAIVGAGAIVEIQVTRIGNLAITLRDLDGAKNLLETTAIGDTIIKSRIIEESITTKYLLKNISTEIELNDIAKELDNQGIKWSQITRFTKPQSLDKIPVVLIKEIGKVSREHLYLFYQRYRITAFKEFPKICKRCMRFNHFQHQCDREQRCAICGDSHETKDCIKEEPECFRCGDKHAADYKYCPKIIEVGKTQRIAKKEGIPFREARKIVEIKKSFASVVASGQEKKTDNNNIKILLQRVEEISNKLEKLQAANEELKTTIEELTKTNNKQQEIIRTLKITITEFKEENTELKSELNRVKKKRNTVSSESPLDTSSLFLTPAESVKTNCRKKS